MSACLKLCSVVSLPLICYHSNNNREGSRRGIKLTSNHFSLCCSFRPVPMTTQAWTQVVWDPSPFSTSDPMSQALAYYARWGAAVYGLTSSDANAFASLWAAYFAIPFIQAGMADNFFTVKLQSMCTGAAQAVAGNGRIPANVLAAAEGVLKTLNGNATYVAALGVLQQAQALQPRVAPERQQFFVAHTLLNMAHIAYPGASHALAAVLLCFVMLSLVLAVDSGTIP